MEQRRTIVLFGASLSVAAIGASLAAQANWQVVPMDAASPAAAESLHRLRPDVVLFDLAAAWPDTVISLLTELPDLQLIGVDLARHQALVLSGEQPRLFTIDDFVRLVDATASGPSQGGSQ